MATDAPPAARLNPGLEESARRTPGDAELRVTQQFAIFVGAGYLAYGLLSLGNIVRSLDFMASWWAVGGPIAVFGSGMAVGVVAAVGARHLIRPTIVVAVVTYVVIALLTPLAWKNGLYSDERGLWYSQFPGLVGVAIGLGWPGKQAVAYLAVLTTAATAMCRIVKPAELNIPVGPDLAFAFAYSLPFVMAVTIGVRTSRVLDETRAATFEVAGRTAAARARADERRRFDALTHDGVMTVLLGAARLGTTSSIQSLAKRTIAELGDSHDGPGTIDAAEAVAQLQSTVTDIDDNIQFTIELPDSADSLVYPQEAVRTMAAATGEALRNSLRHAGDDTAVSVRVTAGEALLEVAIEDNGRGFDVHTVPPHRLGIAVSIRGRMDQLDGGSSTVASTPGVGTTIALAWKEPT